GGEKYLAGTASALLKRQWQVDIFWHDLDLIDQLQTRFEIKLPNCQVNPAGFACMQQGWLLAKLRLQRHYDLLLQVSDGSIPSMFSRNNILHFQVPFQNIGGRSVANQLKGLTIQSIVCNSTFTKAVVDQEYGFE